MNHAEYKIVGETDDSIFIEDLCGKPGYETAKSVTNDAEWVIETLIHEYGMLRKKVVYQDTEGQWDELIHDGNVFLDFGTFRGNLPENL